MDLIHAQQGEYLVVTVNAAHINASAMLEFDDSMNAIDESISKILLNFEQVGLSIQAASVQLSLL